MFRLATKFITLCLAGLYVTDAHSAIVIDVDMDTVEPGIQRTRAAAVGEMFDVELLMTTDSEGVSSYSISLQFDNTELAVGTAPDELLPAGFAFHLAPGVIHFSDVGTGLDQFSSFDAATFGSGPANTTFSLGTVGFRVLAVTDDGQPDVNPGFFAPADEAFDNSVPGRSLIASAVLNGGSVTAIPEPAAVLALLFLGAFVGLRRTVHRRGRCTR